MENKILLLSGLYGKGICVLTFTFICKKLFSLGSGFVFPCCHVQLGGRTDACSPVQWLLPTRCLSAQSINPTAPNWGFSRAALC